MQIEPENFRIIRMTTPAQPNTPAFIDSIFPPDQCDDAYVEELEARRQAILDNTTETLEEAEAAATALVIERSDSGLRVVSHLPTHFVVGILGDLVSQRIRQTGAFHHS